MKRILFEGILRELTINRDKETEDSWKIARENV